MLKAPAYKYIDYQIDQCQNIKMVWYQGVGIHKDVSVSNTQLFFTAPLNLRHWNIFQIWHSAFSLPPSTCDTHIFWKYDTLCFSVPPSTPIIVEKQQGVVRGADVGPFEIGGSLIVTCKVFGGAIRLWLIWLYGTKSDTLCFGCSSAHISPYIVCSLILCFILESHFTAYICVSLIVFHQFLYQCSL